MWWLYQHQYIGIVILVQPAVALAWLDISHSLRVHPASRNNVRFPSICKCRGRTKWSTAGTRVPGLPLEAFTKCVRSLNQTALQRAAILPAMLCA